MAKKKRNVAALVRVSTDEQDVDSQRQQIERWAAAEGAAVTWYEEKGVSGTAARRPVLERLLRDARQRKFDVLVVPALDRIGRSVVRVVTTLDELRRAGVDVVSLRESLDFRGPFGAAMAAIIGAVAELEHEAIKTRVREGLKAAQARGVRVGRPPLEWTDEDLANLQCMRAAGLSLAAIAKELVVFDASGTPRSPSVRSIQRAVRRAAGE